MEFLRFGSSIPGSYWGCCAVDIIQDFNQDPDTPQSIQIVSGDGGGPILRDREPLFAGLTYGEIFKTRIRIGTFSTRNMPNHAFFAILTQSQCGGEIGKKWLAILKEAGFEFFKVVDNSVYSGETIKAADKEGTSSHPNYIFYLVRNIGTGAMADVNQPPQAWLDLPEQTKTQLEIWNEGETVLYKQSEVESAGVPVIYAGLRSKFPQQSQKDREYTTSLIAKQPAKAAGSPTGGAAPTPPHSLPPAPVDPFASVEVGYEEEEENYEPEMDCCDEYNPCNC